MATIKSFTNIEQSKKLAEILPLESADMGWNVFVDGTTRPLPINDWDLVKDDSGNVKFYHAWSLSALLSVLPEGYSSILTKSFNGKDYYCKLDGKPIETIANNLVDACYEMILKLNELKML